MKTLRLAIDADSLRELARGDSFEQGEEYFEADSVHAFNVKGDEIAARVRGTHDYRVRLTAERGLIDFACSCPLGRDGNFCKHCVAVGLAWLAREEAPQWESVRRWLESQEKTPLVEMVIDAARHDEALKNRLFQGSRSRYAPQKRR